MQNKIANKHPPSSVLRPLSSGLNILVDCGIAQGNDVVEPMERLPIAPEYEPEGG